MVAISILAALSVSALAAAHPHPHGSEHGSETRSAPLPGRWYQDEEHPVHALFRRQGKRQDSPDVGSPAWAAQYPSSSPDPNQLPQEWVNALNDAKSSGKIPAVPPSTSQGGNAPTYPSGVDRNSANVCANTDRVCRLPEEIWDAPDGIFGVGFDDGPTDASPRLYDFLQQQNIDSTHFMIGVYIRNEPSIFQMAYDTLHADIAVHTYTHPFMTTQTDEQVVGQLGWTMQIIYDSTDGKVPRYWRPPYGDIDTRVSAIAREVFGMTAIMWNQDTEDWQMQSNPPGTTLDAIHRDMTEWLTGPKSPGLIVLEHELTDGTVQAFIDAYPLIGQNGWTAVSQARLDNSTGIYQDGEEDDDPFNSLITPSSSSAPPSSAPTSSGPPKTSNSAPATSSSSNSGLSAQSNTSGSAASFLVPSLFCFAALVGGTLALL